MPKEQFRELKTVSRTKQRNLNKRIKGRPVVNIAFEIKERQLNDSQLLAEIQRFNKPKSKNH